jgi:hypothetical protein
MGTNVVRLVRIEHRRIGDMLRRLEGQYRRGSSLPARTAGELSAHAYATTSELLPFTETRADPPDGVCRDTIEDLVAVAAELDRAPEPPPGSVVSRAIAAFDRHVEVEEEDILTSLEETTEIAKLRHLGQSFRRAHDSALKTRGERPDRYRRPRASRAELYERARRRGVPGRSTMTREELAAALQETR